MKQRYKRMIGYPAVAGLMWFGMMGLFKLLDLLAQIFGERNTSFGALFFLFVGITAFVGYATGRGEERDK